MRNHSTWTKIFLISLMAFLLLLGPAPSARAISVEDETAMGQKFLESIRKQFNFLDDDSASDYLNDLGQYLVQAADTKPFPFQFYMVRDNTLNAFAGPGGHVFMFSGLVSTMASVDELAAVLCHEVSHVTARHLSERMDQAHKLGFATMAGMLAGILIGGKTGGAIASGTLAGSIQKQLGYSREDERQADQMGYQYMCRSGFDPAGMITTLTNLEKGQYQGADVIPPYLLTHPGGPERISNIESMLSSPVRREEKDQAKRYREHFPFFKTLVRARTGEPHEVEAEFRKALEKDPGSPLALYGLGILWQERSDYDKAIQSFRQALRSRPDSVPIMRKLAESYQMKGMDKEAVDILERVLREDNRDKASLFLLAKSYQNMEEHTRAIRILERLLLLKPVKDETFYNLGVSYGRENRLALAHFNFGIYFKKLGESGKAIFHFQKAEGLSGGDPVLAQKIREEAQPLRRR